MGLHLTRANSECLAYTGARGFDYRYGTMAALFRSNGGGTGQALISTNGGGVTGCAEIYVTSAAVNAFWFGPNGSQGAITIPANVPVMYAATKATGSVNVRGHVLRYDTLAWTHADMTSGGSPLVADAAVFTDVTIGADDNTGATGFDGDVWAAAMWPSWVMTDAEVERLARGNWHRTKPGWHVEWPDRGDVPHLERITRAYPTIKGSSKSSWPPPPSFKFSPTRVMSIGGR